MRRLAEHAPPHRGHPGGTSALLALVVPVPDPRLIDRVAAAGTLRVLLGLPLDRGLAVLV